MDVSSAFIGASERATNVTSARVKQMNCFMSRMLLLFDGKRERERELEKLTSEVQVMAQLYIS